MPPELVRGAPLPAQGSSIAALRRITPYLRPYAWRLVAMLVAALISVAAQLAIPLLIESVINGAISDHRRALLIPLGLAALALGVAEAGGMMIRRWVQGTAITGIEKSMRTDLYAHVQRLHPGFHDSWQSGQLLSRATTDLSAIRRFAGFGLVYFIINIVTFVAVVVLLVRLNWWLGLLTGGLFAPVVVVCTRFERKYKVLARRAQDQQGDLATFIEESAGGIRVLKALGRRREAARRHAAGATTVYRTQVEKAKLLGSFWAVLDLMPNAALGFIMLLGALAVGRHELTLGALVAFIALALQLVWPIEAMGYVLASAQEAGTAAQRVYELLDTKTAVADGAAADAAPARAGRAPGGVRLAFSHVAFCHPGATQPVLSDVTLELEPGKTLVLTGATGSGKTTLLQLVPRLADVTAGSITLDGTDIRQLPLDGLRARVACAFEEATLFSASVRENVTFGAPDASDDDIAAALTAAQASFAYDLPWGLDTRIGEQGMSLSGGQRQRIALARAILSGPDVLLLDDPLSAVDVQTEARATRALGQVLAGTTALVVAHRPSTVLLGDTVALLADGRIAAVGTHHELMAAEPAYRELMTMSAGQPAPAGQPPTAGQPAPARAEVST
ncbi:MAG TPA: ABC transporter ATP-binding protein [Streptosporangiaceae bacterium]|jgi:ATP-binding cassette subfamily B protein